MHPQVRRFMLLVALTLLTGCAVARPVANLTPPDPAATNGTTAGTDPTGTDPGATDPAADPATPSTVKRARILAVGDLLMHTPLVYASELPEGEWDFRPLFEPVRPWIEGADLSVANLETTLTGPEYPWAGYPSFNTPQEFARDVKAVGFDAVTNANNHALDYDGYGLKRTIEALERHGLPRTGTSRTPEEREEIRVLEVTPSIRLALLAYTYGTNGVPLPEPWSVNMLDPERIASDIARARSLPEVDLVAVALHMGEEYAREPNDEQAHFVDLALQAGADVVLGDHPHVIQRIEVRQVTDQFGRTLPRAVIFSLGNFISNQEGLAKEAGLMLLVDVKEENGVASVEGVSFVPTWVDRYTAEGRTGYRVVAVEQAIRDYEAGSDLLLTEADYLRLKEVWAHTLDRAVGSPEVAVHSVDQPPGLVEATD